MTALRLPRPLSLIREWILSPLGISALLIALVTILDVSGVPEVIRIALGAFADTLPYILFAVLSIAFLKATGAEALLARAFEGRESRMIIMAALVGGLAPFCSCEVIPFVAAMLAVGVPLSAVMAFWLASPLIDPPTLLITAGALGWPLAIAKMTAAVGLGLLGGVFVKAFSGKGLLADPLKVVQKVGCCSASSSCGASAENTPHWRFWQQPGRIALFRDSFTKNAVFLIKWLLLAYLLEALLIIYMPAEWIARFVGGEGIGPIVLSAVIGMPAYLNGYAAPPLLAGLMTQGMSAGAALAFMIAGSVSCIPAMAAVWSLVKPRVFGIYIALGLAGAIAAGWLYEVLVA